MTERDALDLCTGSTPRAEDGERGQNSQYDGLMEDALLNSSAQNWGTPTSHPPGGTPEAFLKRKDGIGCGVSLTDLGMQASLFGEPTERSDSSPATRPTKGLNHRFGLWLLGFPVGWLNSRPSATPSSRSARSKGRSR
jgi:hypothetical protein